MSIVFVVMSLTAAFFVTAVVAAIASRILVSVTTRVTSVVATTTATVRKDYTIHCRNGYDRCQ